MTRTLRGQKKKPLWGFCIGVYAGQYFDGETGLHYNYYRYYDPNLGRYLRADPIGLNGGLNLYAYVQNDPVNWIDPYGLEGWQFHEGHHGGPHFQIGDVRYDAKTLKPIPHKGNVPAELSKTAIKNLQGSKAWAKYLKFAGKVSGAALTVFLEAAFPAEAYAPTLPPEYFLLDVPPPIELLPIELIPPSDNSPCK